MDTKKIYDNFAEELSRFIQKKINSGQIADDILQEVFIKIHSNIDSLNDQTKIRGWLYQITRNTIIDHSRKVKLLISETPPDDFFEDLTEETPQQKIVNSLRDMIDDLPTRYSEALCLHECYHLSQKEIAEKLNLSYSGTKSRIQRGREMLRDSLMKCCHYEFDKYGTIIGLHPITCCCCSPNNKE